MDVKNKNRNSLAPVRHLSSKLLFPKKSAHRGSQVPSWSVGSSNVVVSVPEVRCIKYSTRLLSSKCEVPANSLQFEREVWRETFQSMGQLQKLRLKKYQAFTTLNRAPYHCSSMGRSYDVFHGKISHVEGGSVKGKSRVITDLKPHYVCRCIAPIEATKPKFMQGLDSSIQRYYQQMRKDSNLQVLNRGVLVKWSQATDCAEMVCDWLLRYGNIIFSFFKTASTLFVLFETMKSASRAVNSTVDNKQRGVRVSWYDCRLYNYGFFRAFEDDILSRDPAVLDVLMQRLKETRVPKTDSESRGPKTDSESRGPKTDSESRGPKTDSESRGPKTDSESRGPKIVSSTSTHSKMTQFKLPKRS